MHIGVCYILFILLNCVRIYVLFVCGGGELSA